MINHKDITVDSAGWYIGLAKLTGKPIKEIWGRLSREYGDISLVLVRVEFGDGTFAGVEGEHDFPYLVNWGPEQPNLDEETLGRLYREANEG